MKQYALARRLRGFRPVTGEELSTLRVIVERRDGEYVWVRTADLLDAGHSLVLDAAQVEEIPEWLALTWVHRDGLVELG